MAKKRKRSERADVLSDIRKTKELIKNAHDRLKLAEQLASDMRNIVKSGKYGTKTLAYWDKKRLSAEWKVDLNKRAIDAMHADIKELEAKLELKKIELDIKSVVKKHRDQGIARGWRWVAGHEGKYLWDERGRVARLSQSVAWDRVVLTLLKPVRSRLYQLRVAKGVVLRKSFASILKEAVDAPIVFSHVEGRPFCAVKVGAVGHAGDVVLATIRTSAR